MMGELNASHLTIWRPSDTNLETAQLGVIPDYENTGSGIKIDETIPGTPATLSKSRLEEGEKITEVANNKIRENESCYKWLAGLAGEEIKLDLITREGITRDVLVTPVSISEYRQLERSNWVRKNRGLVTELSNGQVGYIYLPLLDDITVDDFGYQLQMHAEGAKMLIIDIRGNIGGSAHDRLLDILSSRSYVNRIPRNGLPGSDGKTLFDGEILLLVDERTSSDAELFAHGFRELGLGRIAGTTTYGAVIGTETIKLLDGARFGVPSVGWYTLAGENLENRGIVPDVYLTINLTLLEQGEDSQLQSAVKILLGGKEQ
jgi:C-terminal processing protease CtpA/Prc